MVQPENALTEGSLLTDYKNDIHINRSTNHMVVVFT